MKKTLLVLPTLLLLVAPAAVLAEKQDNENHGSQVSIVAKDDEENHGAEVSEVAKDNHGTQVVVNVENRKPEEDENNENEREGNEGHGKISTVSANGNQQLKIKIKLNGNRPGSTISATSSAQIKVSGPLDLVIKALENILNFLKGLV